jgi:hypothetical protein
MIRLRHPLFVLLLSLLAVTAQLGGAMHALSHVGDAFGGSPEHSLSAAQDDACAMCALYAGGASALTGDSNAGRALAAPLETSTAHRVSVAAAAPDFYRSRAPPTLL